MCTSNFDASSSLSDYASSRNGQLEIANGVMGLNDASNTYFQAQNQNNYLDAQQSALNNTASSYAQTSRDVIEKNRDQLAWVGYQSQDTNAKTINDQAFRGIDTNVGSASSVRQGQQLVDQVNMDNMRYNAMLQSFGYQRAELNAQQKAQSMALSQTNPWLNAVSTLGKTALSIYAVSGSTAGSNLSTGASNLKGVSIYPTINSIYNQ